VSLSLVGFGGIALQDLALGEASRLVSEAVDRGVNYFDSAPTYGDSENVLGPALAPYRDRVFLACKTDQRHRETAARQLEESLRALRTDSIDLYQVHEVDTLAELETVFGPGGAMETFEAAQQAGKIRWIGFSSHIPAVAVEMLRRYPFVSILFPFTYASWYRGFGPDVLAEAAARGVARLAIKSMVRAAWPEGADVKAKQWWYQPAETWEEADLALRWALSLDLTAAVTGGLPHLCRLAFDIGSRFTPLTPGEETRVRALAGAANPLFPCAQFG